MANETNLCAEESWTLRTRNCGRSSWCGNDFSKFLAAFRLASQTFVPRLTTSRNLSLFFTRYSRQLGVILKGFVKTFSVSLKHLFWEHLFPEIVRQGAVSSGGGELSCGQHDQPNEAMIASRCWEEKPELKLRCRRYAFPMWSWESFSGWLCESGSVSLHAVDR